jgi:hypothetical protein
MTEAANELEIQSSHIWGCCNGQRKTAGGYGWQYPEIVLNEGEVWGVAHVLGEHADGPETIRVTNHGRVWRRKGVTSFGSATPEGYLFIRLLGRLTYMVHRLVALAFVANVDDKPTVNHLDRDKTNNKTSNLCWATDQEQAEHVVATTPLEEQVRPKLRKAVLQYKSGKLVAQHESLKAAAAAVGGKSAAISACLAGGG